MSKSDRSSHFNCALLCRYRKGRVYHPWHNADATYKNSDPCGNSEADRAQVQRANAESEVECAIANPTLLNVSSMTKLWQRSRTNARSLLFSKTMNPCCGLVPLGFVLQANLRGGRPLRQQRN